MPPLRQERQEVKVAGGIEIVDLGEGFVGRAELRLTKATRKARGGDGSFKHKGTLSFFLFLADSPAAYTRSAT